MDLPCRFTYGPQWRQIRVMLALGIVLLFLVGRISHGLGLALSFLPLLFALLGTVRLLFLPKYLELRHDSLLLQAGFLRTRFKEIAYADIDRKWEVKRGIMTTLHLQTRNGSFEITSTLLPNLASYHTVRDFINSRVTPKEQTPPPVEPGRYCFKCSYEGNGAIYNSNGQILWHTKTLHRRPHYPYGLFRLPDFVAYDPANQELFRIKLERKWALAQFVMLENGLPICTINQRSLLRNKFTLAFSSGEQWVFRMPLFTVSFGGSSKTGEKIRARVWSHNVWYVQVDPKVDRPQLTVALAFIHRERLRFN